MAVVDQYGKVHGLENIRVVDASIMPDCIRANTNVTTMMIGERVSELILQGNPPGQLEEAIYGKPRMDRG